MAAITSTNSATPSLQASLVKSRLEAVKREVDQAEAKVENLRDQTDAAESELEKSQSKVRNLSSRANSIDPTYQSNIQASQSSVPAKTQELLLEVYSSTSAKRLISGNSLKTNPAAAPIFNSQGQATGRIINLSV